MFGIPEWSIGVGVIILCVAAGQVMVRLLTSKIPRPEPTSPLADPTERSQMLQDIQVRLGELDQLTQRIGELEERVDFAERLLAKQREEQRLGPPHE
jgi:hypothetical protein